MNSGIYRQGPVQLRRADEDIDETFSNAETAADGTVALPDHPNLGRSELDRTVVDLGRVAGRTASSARPGHRCQSVEASGANGSRVPLDA